MCEQAPPVQYVSRNQLWFPPTFQTHDHVTPVNDNTQVTDLDSYPAINANIHVRTNTNVERNRDG